MPRCRPLVATVVVAAVLLGSGSAAVARDGERSRRAPVLAEDPTTSTTPTPTTTTLPSGIDVGHQGDQSGAGEAPEDVEVEPADPDNVSEVLRISTEEAEARKAALQAELDALDAEIDRLEADLEAFAGLVADLADQQLVVARRSLRARELLVERAVGAYVRGNTPELEAAALGATDLNEAEERSTLVSTVLDADQDEAERLLARRLDVTARLSRVLEQEVRTRAELDATRAGRRPLVARLRAADFTVQVLGAGSEIVITGFVFPVADPHTFASTFGAPRSGGRSHEGNDIFAPRGTALLASENGVIANMGTGTLGGIKLWVYGESGTRYYYAHLQAYAPGITEGTVVRAGDVVGYVGDSGNAVGTPPHLHYEIHPGGGDAIDPYPLLHAVDQVDGVNVVPGLYDPPGL